MTLRFEAPNEELSARLRDAVVFVGRLADIAGRETIVKFLFLLVPGSHFDFTDWQNFGTIVLLDCRVWIAYAVWAAPLGQLEGQPAEQCRPKARLGLDGGTLPKESICSGSSSMGFHLTTSKPFGNLRTTEGILFGALAVEQNCLGLRIESSGCQGCRVVS